MLNDVTGGNMSDYEMVVHRISREFTWGCVRTAETQA